MGAKHSDIQMSIIAEGLQYSNYELRDEIDDLQGVIKDLRQANTALLARSQHFDEMNQRVSDVLNTTITSIISSGSWRFSRFWHNRLGISDVSERLDGRLDTAASIVLSLYQSFAWDLTAPARLISHLFNRRGRLR
jgi:hypothetical protein